jgi:hypothetical protein
MTPYTYRCGCRASQHLVAACAETVGELGFVAVKQRDAWIPVEATAGGCGIAHTDDPCELLGSLRHESLEDQLQLRGRVPGAVRYR